MNMKRFLLYSLFVASTIVAVAQSKVYFTKEITPESLVKIYKALDRKAKGNVAVKISTGEPGGKHFLQPELIGKLVKKVDGTIVECNTAYNGPRFNTDTHKEAARKHGFYEIADVDIMDETGDLKIPVQDTTRMKYNIVGANIANYDFMINLAHFKGHQMGGFGGVLKNASIGVASKSGKTYIHSAGRVEDVKKIWRYTDDQDGFIECMAAAAQAVHNYFDGGKKILYINVMNNLSIDCDCNGRPAAPQMKDVGILASLDPVALDKACLDIVFGHDSKEGDTSEPLKQRINSLHGTWIVEYAEKIGLGTRTYKLIDIDK